MAGVGAGFCAGALAHNAAMTGRDTMILDAVEAGPACGVCAEACPGALYTQCERCGLAMHDDCYLEAVASVGERARLLDPDHELEGYLFCCPRCRS